MACLVPSRARRNRRSLEEQRIEWGNAFLRAVSVSVRGVKVPRGTRLFFSFLDFSGDDAVLNPSLVLEGGEELYRDYLGVSRV